MRRGWGIGLAVVGVLAVLAVSAAPAAWAAPAHVNRGAGIWADGVQWGTVGTPAVVSGDHPLSFYDMLVYFPNSNAAAGQAPVAERAPGDSGYHGGNWVAFTGTWTSSGFAHYGGTAPTLTSIADVQSNAASGYLTLTQGNPNPGGAAYFRCPLIAFSS